MVIHWWLSPTLPSRFEHEHEYEQRDSTIEMDGGTVALVCGGVGGEGCGERVEIALAAGGGVWEKEQKKGRGRGELVRNANCEHYV